MLTADSTQITMAVEVVKVLTKAMSAVRIYPDDSPMPTQFLDAFHSVLSSYLEQHGVLLIGVSETCLLLDEEAIYENTDVQTSLAFMLHRDGIKELVFTPGVEPDESNSFVRVLARCDLINRMEDDILTLLWEQDFRHIGYQAVDEFFSQDEDPQADNASSLADFLDFSLSSDGEAAEKPQTADGAATPAPPVSAATESRTIFALSEREQAELNQDIAEATNPTFELSGINLLLKMLALEEDPDSYRVITQTVEQVLDGHLAVDDYASAARILRRLRDMMEERATPDWKRDLLIQCVEAAGNVTRITRIGRILDKNTVDFEEVRRYLVLLRPNAVPHLMDVLAELQVNVARSKLCHLLAEIGKDSVEAFYPYLTSPRWYVVRNAAYILGMIASPAAAGPLEKAYQHEDSRVKREVLLALRAMGSPKSVTVFRAAIRSQDSYLRSVAAVSLGQVGGRQALPRLTEVIDERDFPERDDWEIEAFFQGVGAVGSNESIPYLKEKLLKKVWFGKQKVNKLRAGAAIALALIPTEEARAVLESGLSNRDLEIQTACRRALHQRAQEGVTK